jgi:hypothetical protein
MLWLASLNILMVPPHAAAVGAAGCALLLLTVAAKRCCGCYCDADVAAQVLLLRHNPCPCCNHAEFSGSLAV